MQSSPSIEGYKLPAQVDPVGELCLTIRIPNDPAYVQAVIGALYDTTIWTSWQRDAAHIGIQAARKMKPRWFEAVQNIGICGEPSRVPGGGLLEDFEMPLRVDCDCNVFITCCDGTEKQLLTADQVKALLGNQPPQPVPQPAPGGCTTINLSLQANGKQVIPIPVNTGDTIQISNVNGATNDGTLPWWCQSGQLYYAGECHGTPVFLPLLDPVGTAPHMSILGDFGAGVFAVGTGLFTVPGGIVNQQMTLSVNVGTPADASGEYTFLVTVCNNQAGSWSHTFDFTMTDGGFIPQPDGSGGQLAGQWIPGVGWVATDFPRAGVNWRAIDILATFAARDITGEGITYDLNIGTIDSPSGFTVYEMDVAATAVISQDSAAVTQGIGVVKVYADPVSAATTVELTLISDRTAGAQSGTAVIMSLTLTGVGTDPF